MNESMIKFIQKNAPEIEQTLKICVIAIQKLTEYSTDLVAKIHSVLDCLDKLEEDVSEFKGNLFSCKKSLQIALASAGTFVTRIEKSLLYGDLRAADKQDMLNDILEKVKKGKYQSLKNYLAQLSHFFGQCKTCYNNFKVLCDETIPLCDKGLAACQERISKAASSDHISNTGSKLSQLGVAAGIGGAVVFTVGGIATLSVLAGFVTFGIGTPIVATALGVGATSVGIITHGVGNSMKTASDCYKNILTTFKEIRAGFESLKDTANTTDRCMNKLKELLADKLCDKESVSVAVDLPSNYRGFESVFFIMLDGFQDARKKIKAYRASIEKDEKKLL